MKKILDMISETRKMLPRLCRKAKTRDREKKIVTMKGRAVLLKKCIKSRVGW